MSSVVAYNLILAGTGLALIVALIYAATKSLRDLDRRRERPAAKSAPAVTGPKRRKALSR